jgi:hypothetical protein
MGMLVNQHAPNAQSAPATPAAFIITGEAFIDEYVTKAVTPARQYPQFSAIAVLVAVNALKGEG